MSVDTASSMKAPKLTARPGKLTSSLVGKIYTAKGQAGACLRTMGVLQVYQADLDEGGMRNPT